MLYCLSEREIEIYDTDKVKAKDYLISEEDEYGNISENSQEYIGLQVVALDDNSFRKYAKRAGVDYEKVKNDGILNDWYSYYEQGVQEKQKGNVYTYQIGDTITGKITDKDGSKKDISIKLGARFEENPYGIEDYYYTGGYLVINKDMHKDKNFYLWYLSIKATDANILEDNIEKVNSDIRILNIAEEMRSQRAMILVIKIFLYGFIGVIALIGVTNIFNTITSNMELRQKEFAMLKSIGMTKKEFDRMINLETIFYGTKSLLYGIALGLLGTYRTIQGIRTKRHTKIILANRTNNNFNYMCICISIYNNEI